jgi:DNA-binding IscR family transcriptional regulator
MESERFAIAAHVLVYMAYRGATSDAMALASSEVAKTLVKNPGVIRRILARLARAGLVRSRKGVNGGAWLARPIQTIRLDEVLSAVTDKLVVFSGAGVVDVQVSRAIALADQAARCSLEKVSIADLFEIVRKGNFGAIVEGENASQVRAVSVSAMGVESAAALRRPARVSARPDRRTAGR